MNNTPKTKILITGASSGIGEALSFELSRRENHHLILASRTLSALKAVQDQCKPPASTIIELMELDLEIPKSIESVAQRLNQSGCPDIVIHNAGISQRSLVKETDFSVYRRLMEVNFFGTTYLTKLLLPKMLERGSGQFVVVTSLVGKFGTPLRSGYAASKHALHGFFDSLRAELFSAGIRVTIICPGFIKTGMPARSLIKDGSLQNHQDDVRTNRMEPAVCARRIVSAMDAEKEEVYIGGPELRGVYLKRFFPRLFSKIIRSAKVT